MMQNHHELVRVLVVEHQRELEREAAAHRLASHLPRRWRFRRKAAAAAPAPTAVHAATKSTTQPTTNRAPTKAPRPAVS